MCASLPVACVGVLVGVPVFVRVCACVLGSSAKRAGRYSPTGHCELRVLVQCRGLGGGTEGVGGGTEGADVPCFRQCSSSGSANAAIGHGCQML
jgi:hypothetical protein